MMLSVLPRRNAPATMQAPGKSSGIALGSQQVDCTNPNCRGSWTAAFKDRRRPRFEGGWVCSKSCISELISSAIRRELRETAAPDSVRHRHPVPLGLILLAKGWITRPQLQLALDAQQRAASGRLGQWLVDRCGIPQDRISRALGTQWGCPVLTMDGFDPRTMALTMPILLMKASGVVPIRIARDRAIYLGSADQPDSAAALAIQRMSGLNVVTGLIHESQQEAVRREIANCAAVETTVQHAANADSLSHIITSAIAKAQPRASSLIRLHQFFWLRMWLESGAMSSSSGGFPQSREEMADCIFTIGSEQ